MLANHRFLALVALLLLGYAFLNKGFAYWGIAPLYVGELVLIAGFATLLAGRIDSAVLRSPIIWALGLFVAWSALTALPQIGTYGLDTIRDSVIWLYAAFAVLVAGALLRRRVQAPNGWWRRTAS